MKPYYEHGGITIYHGDCREILPQLPHVDAIVTDPPYGIGESGSRSARGRAGDSRWRNPHDKDYGRNEWDGCPIDQEFIDRMCSLSRYAVIFGGNYYSMPPSRCWFVWDKETDGKNGADCELAWTNIPASVKRIRHLWDGFRQEQAEDREHPTQKPLRVMEWCIRQLPADVKSVTDPFAGSGTTLLAAKKFNIKAIGIEIEEKYCEIAAKRLSQEVLQF